MKKITVALCMIVKNEEKFLEKCLQSVKDKVDELIIVDTGSTDATIEIAQRFNAKISSFEWVNDFAAARNFSLEQATSEYILVLDADEYLDEDSDLQKDISTAKDYYINNIKNYKSDGGVFYHHAIRLFKNGIGLKYEGKLHEHLNTKNNALAFEEAPTTLLHHLGYKQEVVAERNKNERNFELMLKEIEENPTAYNYYNMGKVYMGMNEYEEALSMLKKSYKLEKHKTYIYALLSHMLECLRVLHRYEEGINLGNALMQESRDADFCYQLARIYEDYEYYTDAILLYKKCLELGEVTSRSYSNQGVGSYLSTYRIAKVYVKQGRISDAFDETYAALGLNKKFYPALTLLLDLMLKANVSMDEIYNYLQVTYPIKEINDLKNLLVALYELRHPLLDKYMSVDKNRELSQVFRAVAKIYSGEYEQARREFTLIEKINEDNVNDALLLGLLLNDLEIIKPFRKDINVSDREWKLYNRITKRENLEVKNVTPWLEHLLVDNCKKLIILKEFDLFEYLSGIVLKCSIDSQIKLAKILLDYGFSDVALDILLRNLELQPNNANLIQLLGDINYQRKNYSEAIILYTKLIELKREYSSYERLFKAYEESGANKEAQLLKIKMKELFPLAKWLD